MLQKLDSFVPQHKRRAAQSNGAGARSIGAQGRTLNDVLADVVEYIRTMKHDRESCSICREQPRACSKKHSAKAEQLGATHSGHLRERERMLARMLTSDDRILTAQVCSCARVRLAQGAAGFRLTDVCRGSLSLPSAGGDTRTLASCKHLSPLPRSPPLTLLCLTLDPPPAGRDRGDGHAHAQET